MKHGEWLPWCRENLKFPYRTAAHYAELYNGRDKFAAVANLGITEAYRLLSQPAEEQETEPAEESDAVVEIAIEPAPTRASCDNQRRCAPRLIAPTPPAPPARQTGTMAGTERHRAGDTAKPRLNFAYTGLHRFCAFRRILAHFRQSVGLPLETP